MSIAKLWYQIVTRHHHKIAPSLEFSRWSERTKDDFKMFTVFKKRLLFCTCPKQCSFAVSGSCANIPYPSCLSCTWRSLSCRSCRRFLTVCHRLILRLDSENTRRASQLVPSSLLYRSAYCVICVASQHTVDDIVSNLSQRQQYGVLRVNKQWSEGTDTCSMVGTNKTNITLTMKAVVNCCLLLCLAYVEFNNQVNAVKTYFNCQVM